MHQCIPLSFLLTPASGISESRGAKDDSTIRCGTPPAQTLRLRPRPPLPPPLLRSLICRAVNQGLMTGPLYMLRSPRPPPPPTFLEGVRTIPPPHLAGHQSLPPPQEAPQSNGPGAPLPIASRHVKRLKSDFIKQDVDALYSVMLITIGKYLFYIGKVVLRM